MPPRSDRPPESEFDASAPGYQGRDHLGSLDDFRKGRVNTWWRYLWYPAINIHNIYFIIWRRWVFFTKGIGDFLICKVIWFAFDDLTPDRRCGKMANKMQVLTASLDLIELVSFCDAFNLLQFNLMMLYFIQKQTCILRTKLFPKTSRFPSVSNSCRWHGEISAYAETA